MNKTQKSQYSLPEFTNSQPIYFSQENLFIFTFYSRDLKDDNILLSFLSTSDSCPRLIISDFGHSYVAKSLKMHFRDGMSKGGNAALRAPEVSK